MTSSAAAVNQHKEMRFLCKFQMVDTVSMVLDVTLSMLTVLSNYLYSKYNNSVSCSVNDVNFSFTFVIFFNIVYSITEMTYPFAQGFVIYLLLLKMFCWAFINNVQMVLSKVRKMLMEWEA